MRDSIINKGGQCLVVKADVSQPSEVQRLFNRVDEELGPLSVLVNNAGILETQCRFDDISVERFERVIKANLTSCFLCTQQAIKRMSTRYGGSGGAIVNVSSRASVSGAPNEYVDYAASKGAIDTLTQGVAKEVANEGIRVNAVRPGLIYTQMHASGGEPQRVDRLKTKIPMQRGGEPNEVADAIFWLASDNSSFVTGSFVDPSGGL